MIWVVTSFGAWAWDVYAKRMLETFMENWPKEVGLAIYLCEDDAFINQLGASIKAQARGREVLLMRGPHEEHATFLERPEQDGNNYRFQAKRFSYKPAALVEFVRAIEEDEFPAKLKPQAFCWLDADTITTALVDLNHIGQCLPSQSQVVSYLGRKDWNHLEGGFIGFDYSDKAKALVEQLWGFWKDGSIYKQIEWHDSYLLQQILPENALNLTEGASGQHVWPHFPLGKVTEHHKGVEKFRTSDKATLPVQPKGGITFNTVNSVPDETLVENVKVNKRLIKNWLTPCQAHDETAVMVAAGPSFIGPDVIPHLTSGKRVIAMKNAMGRFKQNGLSPWGCILLDPRPHVEGFVEEPDPNTIYFVSSQTAPAATMALIGAGATIVGYHQPTTALEANKLFIDQPHAVIKAASASAISGINIARVLGFSRFHLMGYDLSHDTPSDPNQKDGLGNPMNLKLDIDIGLDGSPDSKRRRTFDCQGQWAAQMQELAALLKIDELTFTAEGHGYAPWVLAYHYASMLAKLKKAGYTTKPTMTDWLRGINGRITANPE